MSAPGEEENTKHSLVDPATFTPHYSWRKRRGKTGQGEEVFCEGVPITSVGDKFGTPTYVYSGAAIQDAYCELDRGLGALPHRLCFAVKSNGNLSILGKLANMGSGFDVVSGGELEQLRHIGVRGDRIVFSGVGKTREEMRAALQYSAARGSKARSGILLINIESEAEAEILLDETARHIGKGGAPPGVSIRVNPDVQAGGHPHISTGRHEHKFGLDWAAARRVYRAHADSKWISWQGISAHIGSQIVSLEPFRQALKKLGDYVRELQRDGIPLRYLDFGGGLGVRYTYQNPPSRASYAQMVAKLVWPTGLHLLLEPGRSIIGPAGVLLTRVLYTKKNSGKTFVIVDAAMNDLLRPALYGAVHPITKVTRGRGEKDGLRKRTDIAGPVCETGDCFLHDWPLGEVQAGEVLAIWTAGAYGMSLSSNYNGRCRAAEVLVEGKSAHIIRRRETQKDLLRTDVLA
jgi:diaminopimelate decarboxylase